jgi:hypothetical protein
MSQLAGVPDAEAVGALLFAGHGRHGVPCADLGIPVSLNAPGYEPAGDRDRCGTKCLGDQAAADPPREQRRNHRRGFLFRWQQLLPPELPKRTNHRLKQYVRSVSRH